MFTDTAALAIALAALNIAKRPADSRRTFGYQRFEILCNGKRGAAVRRRPPLLAALALWLTGWTWWERQREAENNFKL